MLNPSFRSLLLEALREFAERGYRSEGDLHEWLMRLHHALEREMQTDAAIRKQIGNALDAIFHREVIRGGVQKRVPGVQRYTIDRVAPQLRAELDRRIYAGIDLIKLNRAAAVQKTLQRFAGWTTSVGPAGSFVKPRELREAANEIAKPVSQLRFEKRRVAIDQGHKLSASVAHVVAMGAGAIAGIWHDRGEFDHGYDARPEHLARSGTLYLVRGSWALTEGLIAKRGVEYYDDLPDQAAQLPYCSCWVEWQTSPRALPDTLLTVKGREWLRRAS